jgi:ATP-dependent RNA helicase DeaD
MNSFAELNLSQPVQRAITELGYETPSPIQQQALPLLIGVSTDFIGLAATGTGKTAAFGIPLLEQIDPAIKAVQGLIMCPTRELALQVAKQIDLLGKYKGIRALPIYGGSNYSDQIHGLRNGATIVVGTPGRLIDHIDRGTMKLNDIKTVILDEADEMISMGFKEDLETILKATPRESSNIWLFSATMSREVRKVADTYLRSPQQVQVNRTEMLSTTVEQIYYSTRESDKPEVLCKIIEAAEDFYGLVFCQTKALCTDLTSYLTNRGYQVDSLHGDKDQNARERTMQSFRDKKVRMLICTDVASRGLDVKDVTHVINYSIPRELDVYVHRIGRTARSGKSGIAISLVTPSHRPLVLRIENMTKSRMVEGKVPTRKDIASKKIKNALAEFVDQKYFSRAADLLGEEWKTTIAAMSPDEIAGRFITMTWPDIFSNQEELKTPIANTVAPINENNRGPRGASRSSERGEYSDRRSDGGGSDRGSARFSSRGSSPDRDPSERRAYAPRAPAREFTRENVRPSKNYSEAYRDDKGASKADGWTPRRAKPVTSTGFAPVEKSGEKSGERVPRKRTPEAQEARKKVWESKKALRSQMDAQV